MENLKCFFSDIMDKLKFVVVILTVALQVFVWGSFFVGFCCGIFNITLYTFEENLPRKAIVSSVRVMDSVQGYVGEYVDGIVQEARKSKNQESY